MKKIVLIAALALVLTGCTPDQDRKNPLPDGYHDATDVQIWRNADQVPNLVTFCADGLAWAATLSSDGAKVPNLLRLPERDDRCGSQR